jgi:hypothetical protein
MIFTQYRFNKFRPKERETADVCMQVQGAAVIIHAFWSRASQLSHHRHYRNKRGMANKKATIKKNSLLSPKSYYI